MTAAQKPPSNNLGAENISALAPTENRSLFDWLAWTIKTLDVQEAIKECGLDFLEFMPSKTGGMGYRQSMRCGNIVVYFDGAENMGCHFSFTGQGCRQYEAYRKTKSCWLPLLALLHTIDAKFTRADLAIDNVDGLLDIDKVVHEVTISKNCQSRFRDWHKHEKGSFSKEIEQIGKTIYLGSPTSRIKIRFYDKAAQLKLSGHWVRCEIQLMAERANEAIKHLLSGVQLGALTVSILNNYFRPINSESENKSQCTTQLWWASWLTNTEKIRLTVAKAIKKIEEVRQWVHKAVAPSMAMIREHCGEFHFNDFIKDLLLNGSERMNMKHEQILFASRESSIRPPLLI